MKAYLALACVQPNTGDFQHLIVDPVTGLAAATQPLEVSPIADFTGRATAAVTQVYGSGAQTTDQMIYLLGYSDNQEMIFVTSLVGGLNNGPDCLQVVLISAFDSFGNERVILDYRYTQIRQSWSVGAPPFMTFVGGSGERAYFLSQNLDSAQDPGAGYMMHAANSGTVLRSLISVPSGSLFVTGSLVRTTEDLVIACSAYNTELTLMQKNGSGWSSRSTINYTAPDLDPSTMVSQVTAAGLGPVDYLVGLARTDGTGFTQAVDSLGTYRVLGTTDAQLSSPSGSTAISTLVTQALGSDWVWYSNLTAFSGFILSENVADPAFWKYLTGASEVR